MRRQLLRFASNAQIVVAWQPAGAWEGAVHGCGNGLWGEGKDQALAMRLPGPLVHASSCAARVDLLGQDAVCVV